MKMIKQIALAGALALGASTAAQAATMVTPTTNGSFTLDFTWTGTAYSEEITKNIGFNFDLVLNTYTGSGSQKTGYYLDGPDGKRLTTSTSDCLGASWARRGAGKCDVVRASDTDGTVLFSNLGAGTYYFGVYDSSRPRAGTLAFDIKNIDVAAVPLPAGGALLLGAMGAFAALRRRKKAA